jgi:hypothetical protein
MLETRNQYESANAATRISVFSKIPGCTSKCRLLNVKNIEAHGE